MKKILLSLIIVLISTFSANAAITVAVGSVEADPGQIVNIPIYISGASGNFAFWGFELKLNYTPIDFGSTKTYQNYTTLISAGGWITNPNYNANTMFCGYENGSSFVNNSLPDGTLLYEIQMTYTGTMPTNLTWDTENSFFINVNGEELDCNFLNGTVSPLVNEVPAPVLTYPAYNAVNIPLSPTFTWEPVTGATNYEIEVSTDSSFSTTLVTTSVTTNQYSITSLAQGTMYYWRVKTEIDANESVWTPAWKFTTIESPALLAPILISPADMANGVPVNPNFLWNTVVGATSYYIKVATDDAFTNIIFEDNVTGISYTPTTPLNPNTTYRWKVKGANGAVYGPWSNPRTFTTADGGGPSLPPWEITEYTGNNANIGIISTGNHLIGERPFQNGDAIGVFYTRGTEMVCGGYLVWNAETYGFTVWGDNDQTPSIKDGFAINEAYTFKVWDGQLGVEWPAEITYQSGPQNYAVNGITLISLVHGITNITHNIPLSAGWNMISSYVNPLNPAVSNIVSDISAELVIMKNAAGQAYWPGFMNSLSTWDMTQAYAINVTTACTLPIYGQQIKPELSSVPFPNAAWYWIPYYRTSAQATSSALSSIAGNFVLVKSINGQAYWPGFMNSLANLEPGNGYLIYINTPCSITYDANSVLKPTADETIYAQPEYYIPEFNNTGETAVFGFNINGAREGDEIALYTKSGLLIGSGVYNGQAVGVSAWGDNILTSVKDGASDNEELYARLYRKSTNSTYSVIITSNQDVVNNNYNVSLKYNKDAVSLIEADLELLSSSANETNRVMVAPQPVINEALISFYADSKENASLNIYDAKGSLVYTANLNEIKLGTNQIKINLDSFSAGVYSIIINSGINSYNTQMVKIGN